MRNYAVILPGLDLISISLSRLILFLLLVLLSFLDIQSVCDGEERHERIDDHPIYETMEHQSLDAESEDTDSEREDDRSIEFSLLGQFGVRMFLFLIGSVRNIVEIEVEIEPSEESEDTVFDPDLKVLVFRIICFDSCYLMGSWSCSACAFPPKRTLSDDIQRFHDMFEMTGI